MAGHNKWSKIKRKKAAEDQKRSKVFSRFSKEIKDVVREGGADPETNTALRAVIERARAENMPKGNIQRAIDQGVGRGVSGSLKRATYEAYGPGGGALLIEIQTDNTNRSVQEVKQILQKYGGRLAGAGSVRWMFREGENVAPMELSGDEHSLFKKMYGALENYEDVERVITNVINI